MKKFILITAIQLLALSLISCQKDKPQTENVCPYKYLGSEMEPELKNISSFDDHERLVGMGGVVPDAKTAANIAYIYTKNIYGDEINEELPFDVTLVNDSLWRIEGHPKFTSYEEKRGKMAMMIVKSSGRVLFLHHSE